MKRATLLPAALAALLCAFPVAGQPPEVGLERGKFEDPDAVATVPFGNMSAELGPRARAVLDDLAQQYGGGSEVFELAGHTSGLGKPKYNMRLSEARARAVQDYLVGLGFDPARLQPAGYGQTQPLDTNQTATGRLRNRRVVVRLAP